MLGNTFGRLFRITTSGEAYGTALQVIVDGVPAGLPLGEEDIQPDLNRRRPGQSKITSPRKETDQVKIVSGVLNGYATGAPVGMIIYNVDTKPEHIAQYEADKEIVIPGHADYTYYVKYGRFRDWRGAGRANGRETAARVAGAAIAKKILRQQGVRIVAYTKEIGGIRAREMDFDEIVANVENNIARCPDPEAAERMIERAMEIRQQGNTIGGIVEVIARGMPPGIGDPVFDKLTATLGHALLSIGSVKGVEFGAGFRHADMVGSESNDNPYIDEDGEVRFRTNHAGGLLGGITNGEDIVARIVVKPTPLISVEQDTINMIEMEEVTLASTARHDPVIVPRMAPIAEAMMAIVLLDQWMMWRGYASFMPER
jgi:chorismate synthase